MNTNFFLENIQNEENQMTKKELSTGLQSYQFAGILEELDDYEKYGLTPMKDDAGNPIHKNIELRHELKQYNPDKEDYDEVAVKQRNVHVVVRNIEEKVFDPKAETEDKMVKNPLYGNYFIIRFSIQQRPFFSKSGKVHLMNRAGVTTWHDIDKSRESLPDWFKGNQPVFEAPRGSAKIVEFFQKLICLKTSSPNADMTSWMKPENLDEMFEENFDGIEALNNPEAIKAMAERDMHVKILTCVSKSYTRLHVGSDVGSEVLSKIDGSKSVKRLTESVHGEYGVSWDFQMSFKPMKYDFDAALSAEVATPREANRDITTATPTNANAGGSAVEKELSEEEKQQLDDLPF